MYKGKRCADRLRRPVQARCGLPRHLAAAAPFSGPRGIPRRRLLPALPSAGALLPAARRAGRRFHHRPAHHRDPGGRCLRLHPHQRHFHHRRSDLPGERPVQRRQCARPSTCGLSVSRVGGARPDQGHEEGQRQPAHRAGPVQGYGVFRTVQLRPGRRDPAASWNTARP